MGFIATSVKLLENYFFFFSWLNDQTVSFKSAVVHRFNAWSTFAGVRGHTRTSCCALMMLQVASEAPHVRSTACLHAPIQLARIG